jgi:superfamily II DNA helicase RecQ
MNLTNSEYHFSYYENLFSSKAPLRELDINELIEVIKYGYIKGSIGLLRASDTKKEYNKIKVYKLPLVTLSGIFTERNNKGLQDHSGLIQIDIDHVENYDDTFKNLILDEFTYVAFKSPGGKGIKAIVKVNPSESTHLEQYYALEQYYKDKYNIEIDPSCKDVARCMLLSYDPDIFCNPFSEVFAECYMPVQEETKKEQHKTIHLNLVETDKEKIVEQIVRETEKNNIDITDGYETWIRIGYALSTTLGEAGRVYYHRLSSLNPDYHQTKCNKQYQYLNDRNNGSIGLGTLIYFAKQRNIKVHFPSQTNYKNDKTSVIKAKVKELDTTNINLITLLKEKRLILCREESVPAYMIFSNSTLNEMCEKLPSTQEEFKNIKGVGLKKVEKYAKHFLPLIVQNNGSSARIEVISTKESLQQKSTTYKLNANEKELFNTLKELRLRLSREKGMKPYWLFGNSTLTDIVQHKPTDKKQLLEFKGFGQTKVDWFGGEIINEINQQFSKT